MDTRPGSGGNGGTGGGGAGAGIGTGGGTGGGHGYRGVNDNIYQNHPSYNTGNRRHNGVNGNPAENGSTADAMGTLYVYQATGTTVNATGGNAGSPGSGGGRGHGRIDDDDVNYSVSGGGGGGAGGFGGAACNIGTGGPGGGGGGGGAAGAVDYKSSGFYDVTSYGGKGGQNGDGSYAADGAEALTSYLAYQAGWVNSNYEWSSGAANPPSGEVTFGNGGNGGACGSASVCGSAINVEWGWPTQGAGTEADPYLISSTDDWNDFANSVNHGYTFSGKYVKLTNDISVSIPAGDRVSDSDNKPFSGTFLGDGHTITAALAIDGKQGLAPFRCINGATIRDLKVAGTIASNQNHTAGIAGFANGTNTIEDCLVTATLNITSNYAGGIIGHGLNSNTTIQGCAFAGTINGVDVERENIGGIWGWSTSGTPTLLDCLENGTYTNIASMHPMGLQGGSGTITNCYYVNPQVGSPQNACTVSGAVQALTDEEIQPLGEPVATYSTSGINVYANGISYGGNFYYHPDKNIKLTVQGYGNSTENDHWAFIASPVEGSIEPTAVNNLVGTEITTGVYDFDLYRLNPSTVMWENYNNSEHQAGFNIVNGQGYLYATKETKTLVFSGTFNTENSKTVGLSDGFNLVGNPFTKEAYVNRPYYKMNAEGSDIEAVSEYGTTAIPVCDGVVINTTFVDAVTFTTEAPTQQSANNGDLQMTLKKAGLRGNDYQDKAIVSFNESSKLEKFVFNERNAKLYIPQDGNDYAIAFSDKTGEVPLHFKAQETGRYTIGFNFENVKGVRIQLIDKLENNIIDLKAIDNYTFMGSSADSRDRFTLVFTQVETGSIFAYQEGNDIIVNGEGELQVFDMMGRMVMNQYINGVQTVEKPSQSGVYIFRLNEKTQKIVIR